MNFIRAILFFSILFFLFISLPVCGQRRTQTTQSKEKIKSGKDDPWADYKEEKDSIPRWAFGINFGAYFPNKYSANYYNGTRSNINNLEYVMSNTYWYQDIKYLLGADTQVVITGYPTNMHYNVAITGGLFLRYNFSRKNGIFLQVNYTQLKAEDAVTMEIDPPSYITDQHDIRLIPIVGREERALLDLGYQRSFPMKSKTYFFLNGGFTMCYTHVKKSALVVEGREYNLINVYGRQGYVPNSNNQEFNMNQYAICYGFLAGGGAGLPITDLIGLEAGLSCQYYPVNLEGYSMYKPSFSIYLRILLGFSHSKVS
jgi:hypothetical protein